MNKWIKIKDNKNPLIVRFTRSGWHLPVIDGVAVTSQILCISITLNKRSYNIEFFKSLSAILLPHDIYVKYHFRYRFINNPFSIPYSLFISYFMQLFFLPLLTFIIFVIILKFVFIVLNTQYQNKFLE